MSLSIRAITTCHAQGWQQYGRRMATSWAARWPVPLTVWREGFEPDTGLAGVDWCDLNGITWLQEFKAKHRARPVPNYRMDAVRFAHKVAAVIESSLVEAERGTEWLIWVDADTYTHSPVPAAFVQKLLPIQGEYIAWLDRHKNYPECGFYVLALQHPRRRELMERWRDWYTGGALFKLPEWHDSYVLQQLVERSGVEIKSLSGARAWRTSHPFINGPLGAYMDHMKGPRKDAGKSKRTDLKVRRTEAYWRTLK